MKRLYYILIMITVGMFASCSLSFDSFIDEEDADLANNGDGFTAPRHVKNETGTATYQFHENVVWLNHDDYNGYLIEIKDSLNCCAVRPLKPPWLNSHLFASSRSSSSSILTP